MPDRQNGLRERRNRVKKEGRKEGRKSSFITTLPEKLGRRSRGEKRKGRLVMKIEDSVMDGVVVMIGGVILLTTRLIALFKQNHLQQDPFVLKRRSNVEYLDFHVHHDFQRC